MTVDHLVEEIQAGRSPEENFGKLYERYRVPVSHFFMSRGFSTQEAEDLAQETFVRVYRNIGALRLDTSFEGWLFSVARNTWKNALRARSTMKRQAETVPLETIIDLDEASATEPGDPAENPEEQVLARERTQILRRAIEELPPKMRECVHLRVGQGLRYREIATIMRYSMTTVKSQLLEARRRLKPLLEKDGGVFNLGEGLGASDDHGTKESLLDLLESSVEQVEKVAEGKRKQVFVLEMLKSILMSEESGERLKAAVQHLQGPGGERLSRINASAVTAEINRLSEKRRLGRTVTLPTVQAALRSLLDSIHQTEGRSGDLRARPVRHPVTKAPK